MKSAHTPHAAAAANAEQARHADRLVHAKVQAALADERPAIWHTALFAELRAKLARKCENDKSA